MKLIHIWDGAKSLVAALVTLVICGVPIWYTYQAIDRAIAPIWVWVPVAGLGFVAILLSLAFFRKASKGVSPSRERRRR